MKHSFCLLSIIAVFALAASTAVENNEAILQDLLADEQDGQDAEIESTEALLQDYFSDEQGKGGEEAILQKIFVGQQKYVSKDLESKIQSYIERLVQADSGEQGDNEAVEENADGFAIAEGKPLAKQQLCWFVKKIRYLHHRIRYFKALFYKFRKLYYYFRKYFFHYKRYFVIYKVRFYKCLRHFKSVIG